MSRNGFENLIIVGANLAGVGRADLAVRDGLFIDPADAADSAHSLILDQVAAGVAVRMSVLYQLLAGADDTPPPSLGGTS